MRFTFRCLYTELILSDTTSFPGLFPFSWGRSGHEEGKSPGNEVESDILLDLSCMLLLRC